MIVYVPDGTASPLYGSTMLRKPETERAGTGKSKYTLMVSPFGGLMSNSVTDTGEPVALVNANVHSKCGDFPTLIDDISRLSTENGPFGCFSSSGVN